MREPSVVIAGAGPTGMTLAAELALAGVDALLIERRPTAELAGSRAGGLHARSIEVFDQRGIADRFLSKGKTMQGVGFAGVPIDISDFPSRHPYVLALWQNEIEKVLVEWIEELKVPVRRGCDVTGFTQDADGVTVSLSDGQTLRTRYLVGCDGGRSAIRKAAAIEFPGWEPTVSHLLAEAQLTAEPPWGIRQDALGLHGLSKHDAPGIVRIMVTEAQVGAAGEPSLDELKAALIRVYGSDFGVHSPVWLTRFTDTARQAAAYRAGRVLLAGDAAHIHYPAGGQGLNLGVQDAVNLGWKLAQVVNGTSPETLLDTYQAERHPVAARVLRLTLAQVAMRRPDERDKALSETVTELLGTPDGRKRYGGLLSGLELRYDLGDAHPLIGRRMPDLEVNGRRVFALLHCAEPVLLELPEDTRLDLPVVGVVPTPKAVLIRPDGYVAWAGDPSDPKLPEARRRWFGQRPLLQSTQDPTTPG